MTPPARGSRHGVGGRAGGIARLAAALPPLTPPQRFGLRFFLLLLVAAAAAWAVDLPNRLGTVQRMLAAGAYRLARLSGGAATIAGDKISAGTLTLDISYECTGAYVLLILLVFLGAYPAGWRARVVGACIGVLLLTAVNVVRIAVLVRIAEVAPGLFEYFHEYVWQGVFLVLVLAYAMAWVERLE